MYAVTDPSGLDTPDLGVPDGRTALAAAGARTLQVNVADADVAGGLALAHLDPPLRAFLTLTGPVDSAAVATLLDARPGRWWGWRVESEEPLPSRESPDGERLDALANVAVLRRPLDQPYDAWLAVWKGDHTTVAIETQGTFGYVQHRVVEALGGSGDPAADAGEVAAIVEEHFPMAALTDPHAFYGSGGDSDELERRMSRMFASISRFGADRDLDLVPTSRYRWRLAQARPGTAT